MQPNEHTEPLVVVAELCGGPSDGQTMHIERPYRVITAVDPVRADALDLAEGPIDLTHTTTNYRLVWDAQTGGPARTAEGHYRYRYGPYEPLYPDLPWWMLSEFPQAYAWEHVGPGHWRAKKALSRNDFGDVLHWVWLYVGYHERGDGSVVFVGREATQEVAAQITADLARLMWTEIDRAIAHELLPECVVPQCAAKGSIVLIATESGRFASRDWQPGEEIRLCPPHSLDVHRAAFTPYHELPEWLRVDARPEPDPLEEPAAYLAWAMRNNRLPMLDAVPPWPGPILLSHPQQFTGTAEKPAESVGDERTEPGDG